MRFLHIADLHVGKRVREHLMMDEQRHAFEQMRAIAVREQVDAVLIAGDVFDKSVPSRDALELFEELLASFVSMHIPVCAIPGNHDAAHLLGYCSSLVASAGIYIARPYAGSITTVRLENPHGAVDVHLLPFIRPTDVRMAHPQRAEEVRTHDDAVRVALEEHTLDAQVRNVLVAHQFVVDTDATPETSDSETAHVGGIDAVQAAHFDSFDYVALGHLHRAQKVRRAEVRYAGSPVCYSFSEAGQAKSVCVVDVESEGVSVHTVPLVPLRAMREIEASFEDIQAGVDTGDHDDYLHITLTDRSVYDALNRLRVLYPNLLWLSWSDALEGDAARAAQGLQNMRGKTPIELFAGFYKTQTGLELTKNERAMVEEVLSATQGIERTGGAQ